MGDSAVFRVLSARGQPVCFLLRSIRGGLDQEVASADLAGALARFEDHQYHWAILIDEAAALRLAGHVQARMRDAKANLSPEQPGPMAGARLDVLLDEPFEASLEIDSGGTIMPSLTVKEDGRTLSWEAPGSSWSI